MPRDGGATIPTGNRPRRDMSQTRESFEDYEGFVEKFKPKKTTDDCYTPPEVMEVVNTFGVDDVELTVDGHVAHHEVYAARTDTTYVLDRLASYTDESAERFKQAFASYDSETFEDLRYEYWKQHYEAAGIPMDDCYDIEVDKLLKPKLHKWLEDNAASYGFRYSSRDGA